MGGLDWDCGGGIKPKRKTEKALMDVDNSVVIAGVEECVEVAEGIGGINDNVKNTIKLRTHIAVATRGLLWFHINFGLFVLVYEKSHWYFYMDDIESIDYYG